MKIIDIVCQIPGFNIAGKKDEMKNGYQCDTYDSEPAVTLYGWAESTCEEIIARNGIDPQNIGVIINSSICLYETTSKENTSAPGIGYHVQKCLDAKNAFVFETFYTDWGNMIQIASNFMSKTKCEYALLLQTNKFSNTSKDYDNGFSIPDGISIMLLKKTKGTVKLENYPLTPFITQKASFEFNADNKELLEEDILFRLKWNYDDYSIKEINKQQSTIINALQEKEIPLVADAWFKEHGETNLKETTISCRKKALAMHTIPCTIRKNLDHYSSLDSYAMVSFNPFSGYYSVLKLSKNEN